MPAARREVAVGSQERPGIREHVFALGDRLLGRALRGQARISRSGDTVQVVVTLTNDGAGHSVPTGLPERRLQVGVELRDPTGHVIARSEHSRGRVLVDASGQVAPFYAASRVAQDDRIRSGHSAEDAFALPVAGAAQLVVFVRRRPLAHAIWARVGGPLPPDDPMLQATVPVPAPRGVVPSAGSGVAAQTGDVPALSVRLAP